MKKFETKYRMALSILFSVFLFSCEKSVDPKTSLNESNGRITITNDDEDLNDWIIHNNDPIPVDTGAAVGLGKSVEVQAFSLTLVAQVSPPTVNGQVVQATSIATDGGDKAMVSYNFAGAPYVGAIDWFTKLLENTPSLDSRATFVDSDVSSVAFDGTYVYGAEATGASGFASPAVLERLKLVNDKFSLEDNKRVPMASFAGTGVLYASSEIYATSGTNGYLYSFDKSNLNKMDSVALQDARWVAWDKDGSRIVVVRGGVSQGTISIFSEGSLNPLNNFTFPGGNIAESKSTAEIAGGKAFIAAGPAGVQIVSLSTGKIVGSVPRPNPTALGLDSSVVVTNSVSVDMDLMFISNGEAGVYVARGSKPFKDTGSEEDLVITVLGKLRFANLQSVNHVAFKGDYLFVAAGLGGLKIVRVTL